MNPSPEKRLSTEQPADPRVATLVDDHDGVLATYVEQGVHERTLGLERTAALFLAADQVALGEDAGDAAAGRAAWEAVAQQRAA